MLLEYIGYALGGSVLLFLVSQIGYWIIFKKLQNPNRYLYSSFLSYIGVCFVAAYNLSGGNLSYYFGNLINSILHYLLALGICISIYWGYFKSRETASKS